MLLRLAVIILSATTLNANAGTIFKSIDGKSAACESVRNVGHRGYGPSFLGLSTQQDTLILDVSVEAKICEQNGDAFVWGPGSFTAPQQTQDIDGNPIVVNVDQPSFYVVNESLDVVNITPAQAVSTQNVHSSLKISQALSPAKYKQLESGHGVTVRWQFFMTGIVSVTEADGSVTSLGQVSGGAYDIVFMLSKINGAYVVSQPTMF